MISAALPEPAWARKPRIMPGIRLIAEVLRARKTIISGVAVCFSLPVADNSSMALIPKGVAALPKPKKLAATFITIGAHAL